ncbi:hypothetical protein HZB04_03495 [Candidatus Wolfebacteria bacterium]|nr:hypothetical protein [Candidatus Wolfebacteria bacterium]
MSAGITERIVLTFKIFRLTISDEVVEEIKKEVEVKNPRNPQNLAYIIARNKAIDFLKKQDVKKRQKVKKERLKKRECYRQKILVEAEEEFRIAALEVINNASRRTKYVTNRNILLLQKKVFERRSISDLAILNNVSEDVVKQGIKRARNALERVFCSHRLQRIISKHIRRRWKKIKDI